VAIGQGRRVCLQHPDDETRTKDKCIPLEEDGTNVLVFLDQDVCGCCGGACPTSWTACECSGRDRDDGWRPQTSPECGCRFLDIITIGGVVPAPATSVFASKTLLTRSYAEEAAKMQLVAPPVASTPAPAMRKRCKFENRGRMQNENKRINQ
jgi:hypothetical protein